MSRKQYMNAGDIVMVSDFDGDIETIGVEAEFIKIGYDGEFICRSVPGNGEINSWKHCLPLSNRDD